MGQIVTHKNTKRIWLYDYNQFSELSDCRDKIICLSDRDINLIWNAIQNIWTIRGRVYINADGDQYETVDDTQWETFVNWVATMRNNLGEWPVCNDILQSIADSLASMANRACCSTGGTTGSRGAGTVPALPNPYDQTETPTQPPPGFDSMTQYNTVKCNAAQDLINALKSDLIGLSGLTYSGSSPTGIAGALIVFLLTPIPFDDLIALSAYLIYSAYSYTFLAEMSAVIGDNNDDLLCILYTAPTVGDAETNFLAHLEDLALAHFTTSDDAEWVMGAIEYMLQYDAYNKLFENIPTTSQEADCTSCGGDCFPCEDGELTIWTDIGNQGTIDSTTPGTGEVVYEITAGSYQGGTVDFFISPDANPSNQCDQLITITVTSGSITPAAPAGWRTWNALGELTYTGSTPPPTGFPICVSNVSIRSSTPFTIEVIAEW